VLEMSLSAVVLLRANGVDLPARTLQKLRGAATFVMHYTRPDGLVPLVRDADDGRLHKLGSAGAIRDHRYLLSVAAAFLGMPELSHAGGAFSEDALWMLGSAGARSFRALSGNGGPLVSRAFPEAQYFVLRGPGDAHVFVSAAGIGMKGVHGGHAHNDCLSFEAFCQGESFITDSGTYVYSADPDSRNLFKSTAAHNTARVDGQEINRFAPERLFGMQNDARPRLLSWRSTRERDQLEAEHYGYSRLASPVVHRRQYTLEKTSGVLLVADEMRGEGKHTFEVFLHFAAGVTLRRLEGTLYKAEKGGASILLWFSGEPWHLAIRESWVSERYGRKERALAVVATTRCEAPVTFRVAAHLAPLGAGQTEAAETLRQAAEILSTR
jgi:hypothetical protein